MNRETKRRLKRQGQLGPDGSPAAPAKDRTRPPARTPRAKGERTKPTQFLREVRGELRKVAWPTRAEVTNYSIVVFVTLVFVIALIFLLDTAFAKSVFFLFDT